ncbi:hypothetical protein ACFOWE_21550 [Planomonospora corallina]|uniref:Uncharacterized protein n=1 Tax=Planomonospora corallina TaxID=1806052 RepID=A0ABV8ICY0_9ACTN
METHATSETPARPTREEAAAALREVERVRTAIDAVPMPMWYPSVVAALSALSPLSVLLPQPAGALVSLAAIAGLLVAVRVFFDRFGIVSRGDRRQVAVMAVAAVLLVGLMAVAAALDVRAGLQRGWIVSAAVNAVAMFALTVYCRRPARKSA